MKHFFKLIIFFISALGCGEVSNIITPISYKVYCWSFFSCLENVSAFTGTKTQINVPPSNVMSNKFLVDSGNDSTKSYLLYKYLVNIDSAKQKMKINYESDARFVIQIDYKERSSDTLIFFNDSSFILNDQFLIEYNYKILDSVRKILNIKCFECVP